LFTRAEDPLYADVWLRVVESKFPLLNGVCSDEAKVRFATQQLRGPARTWWDHFLAMQPVDHVVEWREFKASFRGHYVPADIMDRKLNEFLALTQGNHTVLQYAQAFNDLCQYVGYHADTDEKKRDRFRRGLSTKLRDRLNTVRANSYNELVNMAISQEDCITARQAEKKRKTPVDEDITSIHTMNGPITRSRARQLNLELHSTRVNSVSELKLGAMDVLRIRNLGEDQQGLGTGLGVEEEQQGRPQQEGDQVRVSCDSISGSRISLH
jgi:hypothetical protein